MTNPLLVLQVLVLLGVANGVPVVTTKLCKNWLTAPLDGGLQFFDGRPLFGASKSLRGIAASITITSLVGAIFGFEWSLGAALAGLSMLGDLGSSFVKRRMGLEVHAQALALDQIPEALLPLLVLQTSFGLAWGDIFFLVLAFVVLGLWLSRVLYKFGIRDQPY
jgi:hypothetical protein